MIKKIIASIIVFFVSLKVMNDFNKSIRKMTKRLMYELNIDRAKAEYIIQTNSKVRSKIISDLCEVSG